MEENKIQTEVPQWQLDLDKVGFIRKIFLSRKWFGADWWFILISSILLLFFILLAIFPQWFAPYDPLKEVGPSFLAPGEKSMGYVLVVRDDQNVSKLADVAQSKNNLGYVVASQASSAFRDALAELNSAAKSKGQTENYQPRPRRYDTNELGLKDLANGKLDGYILTQDEFKALAKDFSTLKVVGSINQKGNKGFLLGTNQLGQDVLSRVIWGTRIALIVGLVSALLSFLIGVPLGLIAGFVSGPFDRILTLLMDSLYTFPGLILAIAISAVLGPGILNVIIAIAVLYIPTYYRIVRGQTLQVKQELYVDAARSLGSTPFTILTKYIFPNVFPSVVIIVSVNIADAILTEAGLSFLGLGLPPTLADWGIDLARGQEYMRTAWWLITMPGIMVSLVTLSFSMLGESLSEIFNPRLAEL